MFGKHASIVRGWLHWPTHAFRRGAVALVSVALVGVAAAATGSTAPAIRHHYHLYPGDVVDLNGFFWKCSYYWVGGPQERSYRAFRCARTDSGAPGVNGRSPLRPLNVVVWRDNVFFQRANKNLYVAWR